MSIQEEAEYKFIEEYNKIKPKLNDWGDFIDTHICKILNDTTNPDSIVKIQVHPKYRIKADNSIISKAFYKEPYRDSSKKLVRIEDKVGTRIVVTSKRDSEKVLKIIKSQTSVWDTRISRHPDKNLLKNPKEFDYNAIHVNLTPKNEHPLFNGITKSNLECYVCELQIRTLLQHAYAEVAHDTIYKGPHGSNNKLVRLLSKAEALMEVTDEYFDNAYQAMEDTKEYEHSFLESLIRMADSELNFKFSRNSVDVPLTNELFETFNIYNIQLEDVEKVIKDNKPLLTVLLKNMKSYLSKQPVLLLISYLVFSDSSELREKWMLEEHILKDIFKRLNFSYGI